MIGWEYEEHQNRASVTNKCREIQSRLISCRDSRESVLSDTRPYHKNIFSDVVPNEYKGFAGSYRGSEYFYLKNLPIQIGGYRPDGSYVLAHQGDNPEVVGLEMDKFHFRLQLDLQVFEEAVKRFSNEPQKKLIVLASLLSKYIIKFLSIHPYANGNGHISRLLGWVVFVIKGFNIAGWDLDTRPAQPFDSYIKRYQAGDERAMVRYFFHVLTTCKLPA